MIRIADTFPICSSCEVIFRAGEMSVCLWDGPLEIQPEKPYPKILERLCASCWKVRVEAEKSK